MFFSNIELRNICGDIYGKILVAFCKRKLFLPSSFRKATLENCHFFLSFRIVVTPHVAGITRPQDVAECVKGNIERFLTGRPLANTVDWTKKY